MILYILVVLLIALLAASVMYIAKLQKKVLFKEHIKEKEFEALAGCYMSLNRIDLETDTYEPLTNYEGVEFITGGYRGQANFHMKKIMTTFVYSKDLNDLLEFVDLDTLESRLAGKKSIAMDFEGIHAGWCRARFIPLEDHQVLFGVTQINEEKNTENMLKELAQTDALTGIRNNESGRHSVELQLVSEIPGALCLFEPDGLAEVYESQGNEAGDRLVISVAKAAKGVFTDDCVLYRRNSGFAAFVPNISDRGDARFVMNLLVEAVSKQYGEATISGGVALFRPGEKVSIVELYRRADDCMEISRNNNGNMISYYE